MSISAARYQAMVKLLEKAAKPDVALIAQFKAKAKELREAAIEAQARKDLAALSK